MDVFMGVGVGGVWRMAWRSTVGGLRLGIGIEIYV